MSFKASWLVALSSGLECSPADNTGMWLELQEVHSTWMMSITESMPLQDVLDS